MSERMRFNCQSISSAGIRLGEVSLGSNFKAKTPSVFVTTSRLTVPHMTLERFRKVVFPEGPENSLIAGVQIFVDKLYETPALVDSADLPNAHQFANLQGFPLVLALEPEHKEKLQNGPDFITVSNTSGAYKVKIESFAGLASKLQPDIMILPADRISSGAPPKHVTKAINRTKSYIEQFMAKFKLDRPLIRPCLSKDDLPSQDHFGTLLVNMDESDLERVSNLPENILRFARGPFNPEEIFAMAKKGIDIFDTSYVDQITNRSQALILQSNLPDQIGFELIELSEDKYFEDLEPIIADCGCLACSDLVTKSYIHHLIKTQEMLAKVHLQAHNLHQFLRVFEHIRSIE